MTKLGVKKINPVRARGGNIKYRALRLDHGNFSWGSEAIAKKVRIVGVVYNASNNELVRTNTLVKNAIVQIDAQPFRQYYITHYGIDIAKQDDSKPVAAAAPAKAAGKEEAKKVNFLSFSLTLLS
jgi:small subunit ribosomal protein S8e